MRVETLDKVSGGIIPGGNAWNIPALETVELRSKIAKATLFMLMIEVIRTRGHFLKMSVMKRGLKQLFQILTNQILLFMKQV